MAAGVDRALVDDDGCWSWPMMISTCAVAAAKRRQTMTYACADKVIMDKDDCWC